MDELFMTAALREAEKAFHKKEAPIGAVAVQEGKIIARSHNLREINQDPLGHAEIYLLRKLSKKLKRWRLSDITIYVTLEPCPMCMGALIQARIDRLVFGTMDPKAASRGTPLATARNGGQAGACGSVFDLSNDRRLNHRIKVTQGVLQEDCATLLKSFFKKLRKSSTKTRSRPPSHKHQSKDVLKGVPK